MYSDFWDISLAGAEHLLSISEDILTEFSLAVGLSWVFLREVGLIQQRKGLLKEPS